MRQPTSWWRSGVGVWFQLFGEVNAGITHLPTLRPWKMVTRNWTTAVAERKLYWKVDRGAPY